MKLRRTPKGIDTHQLACSACRGGEFHVVIYEGEMLVVCCGCDEAARVEALALPGEPLAREIKVQ